MWHLVNRTSHLWANSSCFLKILLIKSNSQTIWQALLKHIDHVLFHVAFCRFAFHDKGEMYKISSLCHPKKMTDVIIKYIFKCSRFDKNLCWIKYYWSLIPWIQSTINQQLYLQYMYDERAKNLTRTDQYTRDRASTVRCAVVPNWNAAECIAIDQCWFLAETVMRIDLIFYMVTFHNGSLYTIFNFVFISGSIGCEI